MEKYSDLQVLVAKKADVGRGQRVLDAGTGPGGLLAIRLAEFVGEDGLVVALDYEREYISDIKDAIAKSAFSERISFLLADLRCIPIRSCSIDAAVSLDAVQNMYGNDLDVEKVVKDYIEESMRIVKSGRKVVVGTRYPVPRNKAQEVYIELRLFESKLEYVLWAEQARYYFEHELVSWFEKAGLQEIQAEIIEHNIPYPRDPWRIRANDRIKSRLKQVKPHARRVRLEEKYRELLRKLNQYGEEWLPTLLLAGTKASKNGQTVLKSKAGVLM